MSKDDIELKLERLVGREVNLTANMKHSSNFAIEYKSMIGTLLEYSMPIEDYEEPIALIRVVLMQGKNKDIRRNSDIWVDARDVVEIQKKIKDVD